MMSRERHRRRSPESPRRRPKACHDPRDEPQSDRFPTSTPPYHESPAAQQPHGHPYQPPPSQQPYRDPYQESYRQRYPQPYQQSYQQSYQQPYLHYQQPYPQPYATAHQPESSKARDRGLSTSSSSSSTSSSLLNISQPSKKFGIGAFFSGSSRKHRRRVKKKRSKFLRFGNSSSSSVGSDLAYGRGYIDRRRGSRESTPPSAHGPPVPTGAVASAGAGLGADSGPERPRPPKRAQTDEEIIELGRKFAEIARQQNAEDLRAAGRTKPSTFVRAATAINQFRRTNSGHAARGIGSSKPRVDSSSDDSDWESASSDDDDTEEDDGDSGLAYGSSHHLLSSAVNLPQLEVSTQLPHTRPHGVTLSRKPSLVDPKLFGPINSLRGFVQTPCGFNRVDRNAVVVDPRQPYEPPMPPSGTAVAAEGRPLQHVYPVPTSDPTRFDAGRTSSVAAQQEQAKKSFRPDPVPIQQPKPITPVPPKVFESAEAEPSSPKRVAPGAVQEPTATTIIARDGVNMSTTSSDVAIGAILTAVPGRAIYEGPSVVDEESGAQRPDAAAQDRDALREARAEKRREDKPRASRDSEKEKRRRENKQSGTDRPYERERRRRDKYRDELPEPSTSERRTDNSKDEWNSGQPEEHWRKTRGDPSAEHTSYAGDVDRAARGEDGPRDSTDMYHEKIRGSDRGQEYPTAPVSVSRAHPVPEGRLQESSREPIDPFQFRVADDAFSTPRYGTPKRPLTPNIVTVEREPDFSNFRLSDFPDFRERLSRKDSFERELRDAQKAYEEAQQSTAPVDKAAFAAATVAVYAAQERESGSNEPGPRDGSAHPGPSPRPSDPVLSDADRAYREARLARRIREEQERSRSNSPDRSVMDKWTDGQGSPSSQPIIITPPAMDHAKPKSPYDGPNADVRIDNILDHPREISRFSLRPSSRRRAATLPTFSARDPSAERERPLLNIIRPTPAPSPAPDRQEMGGSCVYSSSTRGAVNASSPAPSDEANQGSTVTSSKRVSWEGPGEKSVAEAPERGIDAKSQATSVVPAEEPRTSKKSVGWGAIAGVPSTSEPPSEPNGSESAARRRRRSSVQREALYDESPISAPKFPSPKAAHVPGGFAEDPAFMAHIAAGLEGSGFDPNIIIDDASFHRRDSPPGAQQSVDPSETSHRPPSRRRAGRRASLSGGESSTDRKTIPYDSSENMSVPKGVSREERSTGEVTHHELKAVYRDVSAERSRSVPEDHWADDRKTSKKEEKRRGKDSEMRAQHEERTPERPVLTESEPREDTDDWEDLPIKTNKSKSRKSAITELESHRERRHHHREAKTSGFPIRAGSSAGLPDVRTAESEHDWSTTDKDTTEGEEKRKRRDQIVRQANDEFTGTADTQDGLGSLSKKKKKKGKKAQRDGAPSDSFPSHVPTSELSRESSYIVVDSGVHGDAVDAWATAEASRKDRPSAEEHYAEDLSKYKIEKEFRQASHASEDGPSRAAVRFVASTSTPVSDTQVTSVADTPSRSSVPENGVHSKVEAKLRHTPGGFPDESDFLDDSGGGPPHTDVALDAHQDNGTQTAARTRGTVEDQSDTRSLSLATGVEDSTPTKKKGESGSSTLLGRIVSAMGMGVEEEQSTKLGEQGSSFLDDAGTSGTSAGSSTERPSTPPAQTDLIDPEILQHRIRPAIDPYYGDLLPLPPSEPGSPEPLPETDIPLPDSPIGAPEEEREKHLDSKPIHVRRRSETPLRVKTPSHSAVPIQFRLGQRTTPSSPGISKASPSASPVAKTPEAPGAAKSRSRPKSWDRSRSFQPLLLVEKTSREVRHEEPHTSENPVQLSSPTSSHTTMPLDTASGHHVTQDIPGQAAASSELPPLAETSVPRSSTPEPDPVDPVSKNRSSYLLYSSPPGLPTTKDVEVTEGSPTLQAARAQTQAILEGIDEKVTDDTAQHNLPETGKGSLETDAIIATGTFEPINIPQIPAEPSGLPTPTIFPAKESGLGVTSSTQEGLAEDLGLEFGEKSDKSEKGETKSRDLELVPENSLDSEMPTDPKESPKTDFPRVTANIGEKAGTPSSVELSTIPDDEKGTEEKRDSESVTDETKETKAPTPIGSQSDEFFDAPAEPLPADAKAGQPTSKSETNAQADTPTETTTAEEKMLPTKRGKKKKKGKPAAAKDVQTGDEVSVPEVRDLTQETPREYKTELSATDDPIPTADVTQTELDTAHVSPSEPSTSSKEDKKNEGERSISGEEAAPATDSPAESSSIDDAPPPRDQKAPRPADADVAEEQPASQDRSLPVEEEPANMAAQYDASAEASRAASPVAEEPRARASKKSKKKKKGKASQSQEPEPPQAEHDVEAAKPITEALESEVISQSSKTEDAADVTGEAIPPETESRVDAEDLPGPLETVDPAPAVTLDVGSENTEARSDGRDTTGHHIEEVAQDEVASAVECRDTTVGSSGDQPASQPLEDNSEHPESLSADASQHGEDGNEKQSIPGSVMPDNGETQESPVRTTADEPVIDRIPSGPMLATSPQMRDTAENSETSTDTPGRTGTSLIEQAVGDDGESAMNQSRKPPAADVPEMTPTLTNPQDPAVQQVEDAIPTKSAPESIRPPDTKATDQEHEKPPADDVSPKTATSEKKPKRGKKKQASSGSDVVSDGDVSEKTEAPRSQDLKGVTLSSDRAKETDGDDSTSSGGKNTKKDKKKRRSVQFAEPIEESWEIPSDLPSSIATPELTGEPDRMHPGDKSSEEAAAVELSPGIVEQDNTEKSLPESVKTPPSHTEPSTVPLPLGEESDSEAQGEVDRSAPSDAASQGRLPVLESGTDVAVTEKMADLQLGVTDTPEPLRDQAESSQPGADQPEATKTDAAVGTLADVASSNQDDMRLLTETEVKADALIPDVLVDTDAHSTVIEPVTDESAAETPVTVLPSRPDDLKPEAEEGAAAVGDQPGQGIQDQSTEDAEEKEEAAAEKAELEKLNAMSNKAKKKDPSIKKRIRELTQKIEARASAAAARIAAAELVAPTDSVGSKAVVDAEAGEEPVPEISEPKTETDEQATQKPHDQVAKDGEEREAPPAGSATTSATDGPASNEDEIPSQQVVEESHGQAPKDAGDDEAPPADDAPAPATDEKTTNEDEMQAAAELEELNNLERMSNKKKKKDPSIGLRIAELKEKIEVRKAAARSSAGLVTPEANTASEAKRTPAAEDSTPIDVGNADASAVAVSEEQSEVPQVSETATATDDTGGQPAVPAEEQITAEPDSATEPAGAQPEAQPEVQEETQEEAHPEAQEEARPETQIQEGTSSKSIALAQAADSQTAVVSEHTSAPEAELPLVADADNGPPTGSEQTATEQTATEPNANAQAAADQAELNQLKSLPNKKQKSKSVKERIQELEESIRAHAAATPTTAAMTETTEATATPDDAANQAALDTKDMATPEPTDAPQDTDAPPPDHAEQREVPVSAISEKDTVTEPSAAAETPVDPTPLMPSEESETHPAAVVEEHAAPQAEEPSSSATEAVEHQPVAQVTSGAEPANDAAVEAAAEEAELEKLMLMSKTQQKKNKTRIKELRDRIAAARSAAAGASAAADNVDSQPAEEAGTSAAPEPVLPAVDEVAQAADADSQPAEEVGTSLASEPVLPAVDEVTQSAEVVEEQGASGSPWSPEAKDEQAAEASEKQTASDLALPLEDELTQPAGVADEQGASESLIASEVGDTRPAETTEGLPSSASTVPMEDHNAQSAEMAGEQGAPESSVSSGVTDVKPAETPEAQPPSDSALPLEDKDAEPAEVPEKQVAVESTSPSEVKDEDTVEKGKKKADSESALPSEEGETMQSVPAADKPTDSAPIVPFENTNAQTADTVEEQQSGVTDKPAAGAEATPELTKEVTEETDQMAADVAELARLKALTSKQRKSKKKRIQELEDRVKARSEAIKASIATDETNPQAPEGTAETTSLELAISSDPGAQAAVEVEHQVPSDLAGASEETEAQSTIVSLKQAAEPEEAQQTEVPIAESTEEPLLVEPAAEEAEVEKLEAMSKSQQEKNEDGTEELTGKREARFATAEAIATGDTSTSSPSEVPDVLPTVEVEESTTQATAAAAEEDAQTPAANGEEASQEPEEMDTVAEAATQTKENVAKTADQAAEADAAAELAELEQLKALPKNQRKKPKVRDRIKELTAKIEARAVGAEAPTPTTTSKEPDVPASVGVEEKVTVSSPATENQDSQSLLVLETDTSQNLEIEQAKPALDEELARETEKLASTTTTAEPAQSVNVPTISDEAIAAEGRATVEPVEVQDSPEDQPGDIQTELAREQEPSKVESPLTASETAAPGSSGQAAGETSDTAAEPEAGPEGEAEAKAVSATEQQTEDKAEEAVKPDLLGDKTLAPAGQVSPESDEQPSEDTVEAAVKVSDTAAADIAELKGLKKLTKKERRAPGIKNRIQELTRMIEARAAIDEEQDPLPKVDNTQDATPAENNATALAGGPATVGTGDSDAPVMPSDGEITVPSEEPAAVSMQETDVAVVPAAQEASPPVQESVAVSTDDKDMPTVPPIEMTSEVPAEEPAIASRGNADAPVERSTEESPDPVEDDPIPNSKPDEEQADVQVEKSRKDEEPVQVETIATEAADHLAHDTAEPTEAADKVDPGAMEDEKELEKLKAVPAKQQKKRRERIKQLTERIQARKNAAAAAAASAEASPSSDNTTTATQAVSVVEAPAEEPSQPEGLVTTDEVPQQAGQVTDAPRVAAETLVKPPVEASVEVPGDAPVRAPGETAVESPVEAVPEAPVEAPAEVSVEAPKPTPDNTPDAKSKEAEAAADVEELRSLEALSGNRKKKDKKVRDRIKELKEAIAARDVAAHAPSDNADAQAVDGPSQEARGAEDQGQVERDGPKTGEDIVRVSEEPPLETFEENPIVQPEPSTEASEAQAESVQERQGSATAKDDAEPSVGPTVDAPTTPTSTEVPKVTILPAVSEPSAEIPTATDKATLEDTDSTSASGKKGKKGKKKKKQSVSGDDKGSAMAEAMQPSEETALASEPLTPIQPSEQAEPDPTKEPRLTSPDNSTHTSGQTDISSPTTDTQDAPIEAEVVGEAPTVEGADEADNSPRAADTDPANEASAPPAASMVVKTTESQEKARSATTAPIDRDPAETDKIVPAAEDTFQSVQVSKGEDSSSSTKKGKKNKKKKQSAVIQTPDSVPGTLEHTETTAMPTESSESKDLPASNEPVNKHIDPETPKFEWASKVGSASDDNITVEGRDIVSTDASLAEAAGTPSEGTRSSENMPLGQTRAEELSPAGQSASEEIVPTQAPSSTEASIAQENLDHEDPSQTGVPPSAEENTAETSVADVQPVSETLVSTDFITAELPEPQDAAAAQEPSPATNAEETEPVGDRASAQEAPYGDPPKITAVTDEATRQDIAQISTPLVSSETSAIQPSHEPPSVESSLEKDGNDNEAVSQNDQAKEDMSPEGSTEVKSIAALEGDETSAPETAKQGSVSKPAPTKKGKKDKTKKKQRGGLTQDDSVKDEFPQERAALKDASEEDQLQGTARAAPSQEQSKESEDISPAAEKVPGPDSPRHMEVEPEASVIGPEPAISSTEEAIVPLLRETLIPAEQEQLHLDAGLAETEVPKVQNETSVDAPSTTDPKSNEQTGVEVVSEPPQEAQTVGPSSGMESELAKSEEQPSEKVDEASAPESQAIAESVASGKLANVDDKPSEANEIEPEPASLVQTTLQTTEEVVVDKPDLSTDNSPLQASGDTGVAQEEGEAPTQDATVNSPKVSDTSVPMPDVTSTESADAPTKAGEPASTDSQPEVSGGLEEAIKEEIEQEASIEQQRQSAPQAAGAEGDQEERETGPTTMEADSSPAPQQAEVVLEEKAPKVDTELESKSSKKSKKDKKKKKRASQVSWELGPEAEIGHLPEQQLSEQTFDEKATSTEPAKEDMDNKPEAVEVEGGPSEVLPSEQSQKTRQNQMDRELESTESETRLEEPKSLPPPEQERTSDMQLDDQSLAGDKQTSLHDSINLDDTLHETETTSSRKPENENNKPEPPDQGTDPTITASLDTPPGPELLEQTMADTPREPTDAPSTETTEPMRQDEQPSEGALREVRPTKKSKKDKRKAKEQAAAAQVEAKKGKPEQEKRIESEPNARDAISMPMESDTGATETLISTRVQSPEVAISSQEEAMSAKAQADASDVAAPETQCEVTPDASQKPPDGQLVESKAEEKDSSKAQTSETSVDFSEPHPELQPTTLQTWDWSSIDNGTPAAPNSEAVSAPKDLSEPTQFAQGDDSSPTTSPQRPNDQATTTTNEPAEKAPTPAEPGPELADLAARKKSKKDRKRKKGANRAESEPSTGARTPLSQDTESRDAATEEPDTAREIEILKESTPGKNTHEVLGPPEARMPVDATEKTEVHKSVASISRPSTPPSGPQASLNDDLTPAQLSTHVERERSFDQSTQPDKEFKTNESKDEAATAEALRTMATETPAPRLAEPFSEMADIVLTDVHSSTDSSGGGVETGHASDRPLSQEITRIQTSKESRSSELALTKPKDEERKKGKERAIEKQQSVGTAKSAAVGESKKGKARKEKDGDKTASNDNNVFEDLGPDATLEPPALEQATTTDVDSRGDGLGLVTATSTQQGQASQQPSGPEPSELLPNSPVRQDGRAVDELESPVEGRKVTPELPRAVVEDSTTMQPEHADPLVGQDSWDDLDTSEQLDEPVKRDVLSESFSPLVPPPRTPSALNYGRASPWSLPPVEEEPGEDLEKEQGWGGHAKPRPPFEANRDSGFVADSPNPQRGSLGHRDEVGQRDSGVHMRDWTETAPAQDEATALSRMVGESSGPQTPLPTERRSRRSLFDANTPKLDTPSPGRGWDRDTTPTKSQSAADEEPVKRTTTPLKPHPRAAKYQELATSGSAGAALLTPQRQTQRSVSDNLSDIHRGTSPRMESEERRSASGLSRFRTPEPLRGFRPDSPGNHSLHSVHSIRSLRSSGTNTPPLRRVDRRMSGDLRALSHNQPSGPTPSLPGPTKDGSSAKVLSTKASTKESTKRDVSDRQLETAATSTASHSTTTTPVANEGRVRAKDMTDVYDGYGEGRIGSPRSPTRPPSMRRRQSMQVLELENKVEQLLAENRALSDARAQAERSMSQRNTSALSERDAEIESLKASLQWLQKEVTRLTEVNEGLQSANSLLAVQHNEKYSRLESQHQTTSRELEEHRDAKDQYARALQDKDAEIAQLRDQLEATKEQIREMQKQILAAKPPDAEFLKLRDEDYFDHRCQQLCAHVQQWVLRFSKFSDMRACRLTKEINDEKIIDRLDNTILDGSDVDEYLRDRVRRRDVFMSMTMNMIWEFVFTRYLFGMDREQRQKLKSLEKLLTDVGPPHAVRQWRAVTLTLLSRRPAFGDQRNQDTEAVVQAVLQALSVILPPPANLEAQIQSQLRRVMREAVDLSIEMRTQRAEYMMLPPLQPEYDANGELKQTVAFNAALMSERSGDSSTTNEAYEAQGAIVRCVLFPLVVKKGDDNGVGDDEIVICPAQVLVAKPRRSTIRMVTPSSDAGGVPLSRGATPSAFGQSSTSLNMTDAPLTPEPECI